MVNRIAISLKVLLILAIFSSFALAVDCPVCGAILLQKASGSNNSPKQKYECVRQHTFYLSPFELREMERNSGAKGSGVDFGTYDPSPVPNAANKIAANFAKNWKGFNLNDKELAAIGNCCVGYCAFLLILGLLPPAR